MRASFGRRGVCAAPYHDRSPVCGCDGVTYPSSCDLHYSRVRRADQVGCGVHGAPIGDSGVVIPVACAGIDSCPAGERCCPVSRLCVPVSCAGCCDPLPPGGGRIRCESNATCWPTEVCDAPSCDVAGGCVRRRPQEDCTGVLEPVCACDGRTYTNACHASAAGARVRAPGPCR